MYHLEVWEPVGHLGIKGWAGKHEQLDIAGRYGRIDALLNWRGWLMSKRMKLPQKDWDNLKRSIEEMLTARGGSFDDKRAKKGVKSVYRYGDKARATVWHTSYSDSRCAIHNQKSFIMTYLFADIGLRATNKTQEAVLADYLQAAEMSRDEFEALQHENDNEDIQEVSDCEILDDEGVEAVVDAQEIAADPSDWLSLDVIKQRQRAVIELFQSWGERQEFDHSIIRKYAAASGWLLDQKKRADDDVANEDYGLWVLTQQDIFLAGEEHIKSAEVFWGLFGTLWTLLGSSDTRWKDAWSRGNRLQTHIRERVRLCEQNSFDAGAYINDYLNKRNMNDDIIVYRWFFARDGEAIRKSFDKDSDDWFIQNEGRGYAYSLSKSAAIAMTAYWLNKHFIRKAFGGDEGLVREIQEQWKMKGQHAIWDGSQRVWVGAYRVKKKDIVGTCISARREEEIIAENAKLIRYEVLTFEDGYAAMVMRNACKALGKNRDSYVQLSHRYDKRLSTFLKKEIRKLFASGVLSLRDMYEKSEKGLQGDQALAKMMKDNLMLQDIGAEMGHLSLK